MINQGKRGFGSAQIFAIALVVLVGTIFIFTAGMLMKPHQSEATQSTEGITDFYAHYVLMGVLRTPISPGYYDVNYVEGTHKDVIPNPTIADAIVLSRVGERNKDIFLQDIRSKLTVLLGSESCLQHNGYRFVIKGEKTNIYNRDFTDETERLDAIKHIDLCRDLRSASVLLPTQSGTQQVTLDVCAKRIHAGNCQ